VTLGSAGCDSNLALGALRGGGGLDIKTAGDTRKWADSVLSGKDETAGADPAWPQQHEPPTA
jgi:hypothetical protein